MLNVASTDLTGKAALATGASGGIGASVVALCHATKAAVINVTQSAHMTAQTICVDGGTVLRYRDVDH